MNINNLLSIALRLVTIFSKFIFAGWMITNDKLGLYGEISIILAVVYFLTYLFGLEFYYFIDRLVNENGLFNSHLVKLLPYISICLLILFLDLFINLDFILNYSGLNIGINSFILLVFLEGNAQELTRLLIAKGEIVTANILICFRVAIWPIIVMFFSVLDIIGIIDIWTYTLLSLFFISIFCLLGVGGFSFSKIFCNLRNIFKDRKILFKMYYSNIAHRSIYSFDKLILLYFTNSSVVGIYSFNMNIIMALNSVWDASILSKNLSMFLKGCNVKYRAVLKKNFTFFLSVMLFVIAGYLIISKTYYSLIGYMPEYISEKISSLIEVVDLKMILVCFSVSFFIYVYQDLRNYLYALKFDHVLFWVNIYMPLIFFPIFVFTSWLFGWAGIFAYSLSYLVVSFLLYRRIEQC
ncbi:hypothetical protein [Vibrio kanaloae]|uniref:hypothetical protein n=1 Tax=Vibrio kanaloae TaxID=170673 RepID=UPI001246AC17|nr:hypothetical protein [Vibrio kanaloae]KAB0460952.1 hypothetical protein F7Q89_16325 [Vibrio kanaloae]